MCRHAGREPDSGLRRAGHHLAGCAGAPPLADHPPCRPAWSAGRNRRRRSQFDDRLLTGRVTAATEAGISLDDQEIAFDELGPGRVQVEFQRLTELSDEQIGELTDDSEGEHEDEELEDEA